MKVQYCRQMVQVIWLVTWGLVFFEYTLMYRQIKYWPYLSYPASNIV